MDQALFFDSPLGSIYTAVAYDHFITIQNTKLTGMEAEICFRAKNFHNGGILLFTVILRQKRSFLVHLPSEFYYFFFFPHL